VPRLKVVPSNVAISIVATLCACAVILLVAGMPVQAIGRLSAAASLALFGTGLYDYLLTRSRWRISAVTLKRRMPSALAIGVRREVALIFESQGGHSWHCEIHDGADSSLLTSGVPRTLTISAQSQVSLTYSVTPTRRGEVSFAPADVRVRSRFGLCLLLEKLGIGQLCRVYPDFAQVARYAWLAGDHRLAQIGIKTYQHRGEGTDFKQLAEYTPGDPVRHIDWKATQRLGKPIIREFQVERDQCVLLMIDCGRRMRADDRLEGIGTSHFDQTLNAVMLLAYVALKQGDAVGAMTFGAPPEEERSFAPRKGMHALNALMGELYAAQPTLTPSDYIAAARSLMLRNHKRSLVIVITNFRDEDSEELGHALRLLRSRHLVLLASLRERVVRDLASQPISLGETAFEVASAHLYEQVRRDAFNRLAARDALMVDAEPERLGVELVNRYHSVKRAGLI